METKFKCGRKMIPVKMELTDDNCFILKFPYNKQLLDVVKTSFEGRKWLGPPIHPNGPKAWKVPFTQRNNFVLEHLKARKMVDGPYAKFNAALKEEHIQAKIQEVTEYSIKRFDGHPEAIKIGKTDLLYPHQKEMVAHALLTDTFIWAAEMGTGKTLAAFIWMEMTGLEDWVWVAPKSALRSLREQQRTWLPLVRGVPMTYDGLKEYVIQGKNVPEGVVYDESAKVKTPTAQRSIAARNLANEMRDLLGETCKIGLLSGAPAPKSPLDWWHQCEIACPGFLREGSIYTFRERLGIFEDANDGAYKKHVTWRDTEEKCAECGELRGHASHQTDLYGKVHTFVEGKDEVSYLYNRMAGLVKVWLKKDCLDLPEKIYERRVLKPSADIIQAARLIVKTSTRVVTALTRLRMLSDGFQYVEEETGETVCKLCQGSCRFEEFYDPDNPNEYIPDDWIFQGIKKVYDEHDNFVREEQVKYAKRVVECPNCNGTGVVPTYSRSVNMVDCPKDQALEDDLEAHEDVGRLNVYAGFTASVDRVVSLCHRLGWSTIRADGRGWEGSTPYGEILDNAELLNIYQNKQEEYPRICFIGQPGAAGEGLTLTASPTTVFWSNDFNGNSRLQAEDRGHRIGMDKERGGRIVDYIHLDSDLYVLKNLQQKKELQKQSMTGLRSVFNVSS